MCVFNRLFVFCTCTVQYLLAWWHAYCLRPLVMPPFMAQLRAHLDNVTST